MEEYKTPKANLSLDEKKSFKPVSAILLGVGVTIGLGIVISTIEVIGFGFALGLPFTDSDLLFA